MVRTESANVTELCPGSMTYGISLGVSGLEGGCGKLIIMGAVGCDMFGACWPRSLMKVSD